MATIMVQGNAVELTAEEALGLITELNTAFDFIGATLSKEEIEDTLERPVSDDEWLRLSDDFADDVYRFVMDIPVVAS